MLYETLKQGYGKDMDLNCAETILYGANEVYKLGLGKEELKLAAGFGRGMGIESVCGALTASIMVLGKSFVRDRAHESTRIKDLSKEFLDLYEDKMGGIDCGALRNKYYTEEYKCKDIILKAAQILDRIIEREKKQGVD